MFPPILNRVQYLIRWLCFFLAVGLTSALMIPFITKSGSNGAALFFAVGLAIFIVLFKILGLDIPRIKSIGWSPWLLLLLFIPAVGAIFQILLFVMPPAVET